MCIVICRVLWEVGISVWLARESAILKAAATFQQSTEIKVKVVKLLSISAVVQLFKHLDMQDSKICNAFLDWCIEVEHKIFYPDLEIVDLLSVCWQIQ